MKNVDYIIVGDGYAALFFAHQLIKNNKVFIFFPKVKKVLLLFLLELLILRF
jgi:aspartate oxidase